MPPVRSGIAACSAQLVPALRSKPGIAGIDVFVDEPVAAANSLVRSAHEFPWRHRETPYDLTVYQLGNSSYHDYLWPYLFRFPGLLQKLPPRELAALHGFARATSFLKALGRNNPSIEGTMTPQDFLEFRQRLAPASGFQSVQFRELEFLSGAKDPAYVDRFKGITDAEQEEKRRNCFTFGKQSHWDYYAERLVALYAGLIPPHRAPESATATAGATNG